MPISVALVPPTDLVPAQYNPRTMTDEAFTRLKRGIQEYGLVEPLVARAEDHLVIGGHQRLAAAQELKLPVVPVVFLEGLSDARSAALNVLLNNPHAQGEWDMVKLSELLSSLDADGFDATLTGFDARELEDLLTWVAPKNEPPPPAAGAPETVTFRVTVIPAASAAAKQALTELLAMNPDWLARVKEVTDG